MLRKRVYLIVILRIISSIPKKRMSRHDCLSHLLTEVLPIYPSSILHYYPQVNGGVKFKMIIN